MKTVFCSPKVLVLVLACLLTFSGCRTNQVGQVYHPSGRQLPPGQAKKVYGHQSAKAFAPGQQKKQAGAVYPKGKYYGTDNAGPNGNPGKGGKKKGKKK